MYVYPVAGLRSNEGLLLCSTCRKDLSSESFGAVRSGRRKSATRGVKRAGHRRGESASKLQQSDSNAKGREE